MIIEIYTYALAGLLLFGSGIQVAKKNLAWLIELTLLAPLFGRVFGWW